MQEAATPLPGKSQKSAETRARLVAIARNLFADTGYADTGTEAVVAAAGVTRGALYFHFSDKAALFEAVFDQVAREVAEAIAAASADAPSPRAALLRGAGAYVAAAGDPSRRRIYLSDGISVLGAARWHEMENRHSRPLLKEGLAALGVSDVEAMTHLFSGAMVEAARWRAMTPQAQPRVAAALEVLVAALG